MQKEILILAKSAKHGGYCVAGVEVEQAAGGHRVLGNNWVRPVSELSDGTCSGAIPREMCDSFQVGDIVIADLKGHAPVVGQQENWVWAGTPFKSAGKVSDIRVLRYLTAPAQPIWFDVSTNRDDQVSECTVIRNGIGHSLMLVAPEDLVFSLEVEQTSYGLRKRIFATFSHQGKTFQRLVVTEPSLRKIFSNQFPREEGVTVSKRLNHKDSYWLTLSLSPKFSGTCGGPAYHYLLVAAVIDHSGYLNRRYG